MKLSEARRYGATSSGIYAITCLEAETVYVGQAACLKKRADHHLCSLRGGYHRNRYLQRSWNSRGEDSFRFVVLELAEDSLGLSLLEQKWLDDFRSNDWKTFN